MPIIFTKEEIKEFLTEQGYDVEDETILKKFIHDLKKLIKYEEMKKRRRKLGHPAEETVLDSTDNRTGTTDSSNYRDERVEVEYDESRAHSSRSRSQYHDHDVFDGSSRMKSKSSTPREAPYRRPRPQSAVDESRSQYHDQSHDHDVFDGSSRMKSKSSTPREAPYRRPRPQSAVDESRSQYHDQSHDHDVFDGSSRMKSKSSTPREAPYRRPRPQSAVDESRSHQYRQPSRTRSSERTMAKPIRNHHNHQRQPSDFENQGGKREIVHGLVNEHEGGRTRKAPESSRPAGSDKIVSQKKTGTGGVVMKRYTAATDDNGESVIYESDISLSRQPKSRPQTANAEKQPHSKGGSSKRQQPASSSKQTDNVDKDEPPADRDCVPTLKEPDELFHAIKELVFQKDDIEDDDDSLFKEETRRRKLLKPSPHVARDPVSLFHWYKKYNWDIYSVPGEDRHMQLRWNVRAQTVGGYHPCVEVPIPARPAVCRC